MKRLTIAAVLALAACNDMPHQKAAAGEEAPIAVAPAPLPTDAWIGQWPGVEGTYLKIEAGPTPGAYTLTQGTLDGVNVWQGTAAGDAIAFTRAEGAAAETIRATGGAETGLKWLLEKTDCLTIKSGEGYCR
jgi:hypothetical protein